MGSYGVGVPRRGWVAIAAILVQTVWVMPASGQYLAGLYCRGGGLTFRVHANPSPREAGEVTLEMPVRPSPAEAGLEGRGLAPGTCAWALRDGMAPEPRVLFVDVPAASDPPPGTDLDAAVRSWPNAQNVQAYLADPSNFWQFAVDAGAHSPVVPSYQHYPWAGVPGTVGAYAAAPADTLPRATGDRPRPTERTGARVDTFDPSRAPTPVNPISEATRDRTLLRDVRVEVIDRNVIITFKARQNARPFVRLRNPQGEARVWHINTGNVARGEYRFDLAQYNGQGHREAPRPWELQRGATYAYEITVPAGDGVQAQTRIGTFQTWGQTVTVQITELTILDDSDDSGSGELLFDVDVVRSPTAQERMNTGTAYTRIGTLRGGLAGGYTNRVSWSSGHRQVFQPPAEIVVEHAPAQFRIVVGGDEDDDDLACNDPHGSLLNEMTSANPTPSTNCARERNFAVYEVDLSAHPGAEARIPFYAHSMIGHGGVALAFEVRGYILVTRQ